MKSEVREPGRRTLKNWRRFCRPCGTGMVRGARFPAMNGWAISGQSPPGQLVCHRGRKYSAGLVCRHGGRGSPPLPGIETKIEIMKAESRNSARMETPLQRDRCKSEKRESGNYSGADMLVVGPKHEAELADEDACANIKITKRTQIKLLHKRLIIRILIGNLRFLKSPKRTQTNPNSGTRQHYLFTSSSRRRSLRTVSRTSASHCGCSRS